MTAKEAGGTNAYSDSLWLAANSYMLISIFNWPQPVGLGQVIFALAVGVVGYWAD